MMNSTAIDFNDNAFTSNPYPAYKMLREAEGPCWLAHSQSNSKLPGMWLVSRYDDVAAVIRESASLSKQLTRVRTPESITPMDTTILNQDPPEHTRLRGLVQQAFTPEHIRKLSPRIEHMVDTLLSRLLVAGGGDIVEDLAVPLPMMVIADFIGLPFEDHLMFRRWAEHVLRGYDSGVRNTDGYLGYKNAVAEMEDYFNQLIESRRRQPTGDLISSIIEARDKHDRLSGDELLSMAMLLLVSAHETTTNMLSSGMLALLQNPEQFRLLQSHPEHLPSAIEEMLRFESPIQRATFRITTRPCEFAGRQFQPGEQITAILGAANRDPSQFPDPDRFDITRTPNRHLAFGMGIHICLGAFLARTEARIAFGEISRRMPGIRLASQQPVWNNKKLFRGLHSLPVTL